MSTLTIRPILDDWFFLSFNPNGESWSSLRPDFFVSSSVYGKEPVGQNTVFLTDINEQKVWNVGLFNPPQYLFTCTSTITYNISGSIITKTIPTNTSYTETALASFLSISSGGTIITCTYNPILLTYSFTISAGSANIIITGMLPKYLGMNSTFTVSFPVSVVGTITSPSMYYVPPEVVGSIGIKSKKWYKGQYYIALEDCNIRVKNNFASLPVNQVEPNQLIDRPAIFEDTCIFAEVEILTQGEQGNVEIQNFYPGVNVVSANGVNNYIPFENRKILFPIMMKRDIPPWNGVAMNLSLTGIPNARTTGFSTENKSKAVHLVQLNANEEFKVRFKRSNGEVLPMATDYTQINPNTFESEEAYQAFLESRDKGWYISQASVLVRLSNARPEYL